MKNLSKAAKIIIIIAIAAAALLVIIYFWGRNHYSDHFISGTTINGWDVSDETVEEVEADLESSMRDYKLTLVERGDESEEIDCSTLNLKYKDSTAVEKFMKKQNSGLWFANIGRQHYETDMSIEYDEDKVESLVDALDCFKSENVEAPVNAHIQYADGAFSVVEETQGNELDRDAVITAVKEGISGFKESIDLDELGLYKEAEVKSDSEALAASLEQANKILNVDITYDFTDRQMKLEKDELAGWISTDSEGNVIVDREKVTAWVANMAYETDTFGLSRKFTTSTGVEIQLEGGGDYGWCIDKDATVDQLYAYISTGESGVLQPIYLYSANDRSQNDIGGTYVEVCISTQTLWAYKDGQLITTTQVITGCDQKGYSTPSGSVWAIDAKKTDWKFTNYASAYSDYWMPFNGECGLHDASWQADVNYTIPGYYITSGSHGCVNTPLESMKIIYENLEIGDPVVVYYSTDQVVGPSPTQELTAGQ